MKFQVSLLKLLITNSTVIIKWGRDTIRTATVRHPFRNTVQKKQCPLMPKTNQGAEGHPPDRLLHNSNWIKRKLQLLGCSIPFAISSAHLLSVRLLPKLKNQLIKKTALSGYNKKEIQTRPVNTSEVQVSTWTPTRNYKWTMERLARGTKNMTLEGIKCIWRSG